MLITNLKEIKNNDDIVYQNDIVIQDTESGFEELDRFLKRISSCGSLQIIMPRLKAIPESILDIDIENALRFGWLNMDVLPAFIASVKAKALHIPSHTIKRVEPEFIRNLVCEELHLILPAANEIEFPNFPGNTVTKKLNLNLDGWDGEINLTHFNALNRLEIFSSAKKIKGLDASKQYKSLYIYAPIEQPLASFFRFDELQILYLKFLKSDWLSIDNVIPKGVHSINYSEIVNARFPDFLINSQLRNLFVEDSFCSVPDSIRHCQKLEKIVQLHHHRYLKINMWTTRFDLCPM